MKRCRFVIILFFCCIICYASEGDKVQKKKTGKTIVFAGNCNFPPFEFVDEKGHAEGFDVDLFVAIMKKMNLPYRVEMKKWKSVLRGLDEGHVDVASLMFSNSRAKRYNFGPTIKYSFLYAVYSSSSNAVTCLTDFAGKRVVVEKGTLSDETLQAQHVDCRIYRVYNLAEGLNGVASGKYDIMLCSHDAATYNIWKWKIKNLKQADIGLPPSEICFAGVDEELLELINQGLYKLKHDGTYAKIYDKWFIQKSTNYVSGIIYFVIAALLIAVFVSYIFIHVLRIKVYRGKKILKENNEQLKLALSAGGIVVWGFDASKARYYNVEPAIFPSEGRSLDDEITYIHPDDKERYRQLIMNAVNGVTPPKSLCFRIDYTRTGHWQYIEKEIVLVRNKKGVVTRLIGTHKNITEKMEYANEMMQTQQKLKREMVRAQEADRLKSEFLANMSHEIRTPLNSIVGFSSLMKEDMAKEDREVCITLIEKNSDLLLSLVNDILDFSKLEAGSFVFQMTTLNLSELINVTGSSLASLGKDKDVKLILDIPYPKCMVVSDYNRIRQIMTNFLTNAFKYTERGYIKMGYRCLDGGIRLFVEDTGVGIAEDKLPLVFDRFEKLGSFKQGAGLGLCICKSLVEHAGGKVGVDSVLGKGSTFWAWLPLTYTL